MPIDTLTAILPPPDAPHEVPTDWRQAETELGTPLPADYKALVERYGLGRIAGFMWVFNPVATRATMNLVAQAAAHREVLDELRAAGDAIPFPSFPEPGGLLAAATTDNGDTIHWRTVGAPDGWTIVVQDARAPDFAEHDTDLTGFLAGVLNGTLSCPIFPADFPPGRIGFESMVGA